MIFEADKIKKHCKSQHYKKQHLTIIQHRTIRADIIIVVHHNHSTVHQNDSSLTREAFHAS